MHIHVRPLAPCIVVMYNPLAFKFDRDDIRSSVVN